MLCQETEGADSVSVSVYIIHPYKIYLFAGHGQENQAAGKTDGRQIS